MSQGLNLTVVEDFLRGKITLERLIQPRLSDRFVPLDRLLVAYAVAIAKPSGVPESERLATYSDRLGGWQTDDALIALLRRFYPNSPTSLDQLVRLSSRHSLHTSERLPKGKGVVLLLPGELVKLVEDCQNLPNGGVAWFYKKITS